MWKPPLTANCLVERKQYLLVLHVTQVTAQGCMWPGEHLALYLGWPKRPCSLEPGSLTVDLPFCASQRNIV